MKKILFLLNSVDIGGIETYVLRFLKKSNLKVDVITKSGNLGELEKYYDDLGIKVIPMKLNNLSVSGLFKFFRHLKQERYDVVCDFTGTFSGVFLVLAFFARVSKRIVFFRNSSNSFERTLFKVLLEWVLNLLTFLGSTKILSNSQAAINNHYPILSYVFNKKFEIIRNGVPTLKKLNKNEVDEFKLSLGIPLDKFIVGHVGRFSNQKNQKEFYKIAKSLNNDNIHYVLCGRNVPGGFNKITDSDEKYSNFTLLEQRNDIEKIFSCIDLFLFPSIYEGNPNALIEAARLGIPFVSTNINEIVESIHETDRFNLYDIGSIDDAKLIINKIVTNYTSKDDKVINWYNEQYNEDKNFNDFLKTLIV